MQSEWYSGCVFQSTEHKIIMTHNNSNGCVVWSGNSLYDRRPIVILLTGLKTPSNNSKTGWMLQSYVLSEDTLPTEAVKTGSDSTNCGDCPLRGRSGDRACYVNLVPINNIWRKYKAGGYPPLDSSMLLSIQRRHQILRMTAYGEAALTPFHVWEPLIEAAGSHTGYTHAWRNPSIDPRWKQYLMASVEQDCDRILANSMGWRTFRVVLAGESPGATEVVCRNENNKRIQCEACQLCNGTSGKSSLNVIDTVHGLSYKQAAYERLMRSKRI